MTATAIDNRARGWLFGPVPDLLVGCGVLYGLLFAVAGLFGPSLRALQPAYLIPLLVVLVSMPHYGGTLVRVYEQRADRRSYVIFSLWATLILAALFVWGAFSSLLASWLFTLYVTWSPWHYTGQNYGLAVMFLRRREVPLGVGTKRLLYASFVLGFVLTFIVAHGTVGASNYSAAAAAAGSVVFVPLGIPRSIDSVAFPLVLLAYLSTVVAAAVLLLRNARARDLVPTAAIMLTQALWFAIPGAVSYFNLRTGIEPLDLVQDRIAGYFLWIPLGHAAQYLWVTSYYARGSRGWQGFAPYFGKVLASGVAVWTLPVIAIAPLARGRFEYDAGVALLLASVINLHHFILDGAIWKLRQSKIASVLIRTEAVKDAQLSKPIVPERSWIRRAVWAVAGGGLALGLLLFGLENFVLRPGSEGSDYAFRAAVLDRMALVGRDSSIRRVELAHNAERADDPVEAERQLRRALELHPSAATRTELGHLHARAKRWEEAAADFEAALALSPDDAELLGYAAQAKWNLGSLEQARDLLERQVALQPRAGLLHLKLAELSKKLGDEPGVLRHQREALRLDPGQRALRNNVAWTLATSPDERVRDPAEAIRLAEALASDGGSRDPNELDTLAAAYASAGRFEEAVRTASQAASLAAERGQAQLAEGIRSRVEIYRSRRSYVEAA